MYPGFATRNQFKSGTAGTQEQNCPQDIRKRCFKLSGKKQKTQGKSKTFSTYSAQKGRGDRCTFGHGHSACPVLVFE